MPVPERCHVSVVSAPSAVERSPSAAPHACWGWASCSVWALPVDSESQQRGNKIASFGRLFLHQVASCAFKTTRLCRKRILTCLRWLVGECPAEVALLCFSEVHTAASKKLSPLLVFCFGSVSTLVCSWAAESARQGFVVKISLCCSGSVPTSRLILLWHFTPLWWVFQTFP